MANEDAGVLTTPDLAHGFFWAQLVRLNWALEMELPSELAAIPVQVANFKLTDHGKQVLSGFIDYRKLFELTIYNNAPEDDKPPIPEPYRHLRR